MASTQPQQETTLQVRRVFAAPRERVFRAWTDRKQFAKWFGDQSGIPVIFELLHPDKTVLKEALYGREATRVGGLFLHGKMTPALAEVA